jgi:hypothetical protein
MLHLSFKSEYTSFGDMYNQFLPWFIDQMEIDAPEGDAMCHIDKLCLINLSTQCSLRAT